LIDSIEGWMTEERDDTTVLEFFEWAFIFLGWGVSLMLERAWEKFKETKQMLE